MFFAQALIAGATAALAQSVERLTRNEKVGGSIPPGGSFYFLPSASAAMLRAVAAAGNPA